MPNKDDITFNAESLFEIDPSIPERSLEYELGRFASVSLDEAARLLSSPMDEFESAEMMDSMGQVSGYLIVELRELHDTDNDELIAQLSARLSTSPLINVEYQGVWVFGKTLALYVRGRVDES